MLIKFCFLILFLLCSFLWLLQSLPSLHKFLDESNTEIIKQKIVPYENLKLPGIVICSDLPYTQAGLNKFGKTFNQDFSRQYLREWLNPSAVDSPNFENMPDDDRKLAETTISQALPNTGLKQRLDQILLKCQDFLSSCVIKGDQMSGFDCCENVEPFLATFNGICWIFRNNTFIQNAIENRFGIQITFQIAKNSFINYPQTSHPGLSIFLSSNDENLNRIGIASELSFPNFSLKDKRQIKISIRKQSEINLRRRSCSLLNIYEKVDNSSYVTCLAETVIQQCACVPLIVVLWTLQGDLDTSFLKKFDVSTICTVEEYNECARKFLIQSHPDRWFSVRSLINHQLLKNNIESCRKSTHMPCQRSTFNVIQTDETDLPQEYKNTQDFVSRFSISYDSLDVTEVVYTYSFNFRETLTIIGYNFATWFSIGHFICSLLKWFLSLIRQPNLHQKIQPCQPMIISPPIHVSRQHHQQLAPLNIAAQLESDVKIPHNIQPRPMPRQACVDSPKLFLT